MKEGQFILKILHNETFNYLFNVLSLHLCNELLYHLYVTVNSTPSPNPLMMPSTFDVIRLNTLCLL